MSDDENNYIPEGEARPYNYNLKNIDNDGISILRQTARFLLKEYLHPREFFGKMVKANVEVKTSKKSYRLD